MLMKLVVFTNYPDKTLKVNEEKCVGNELFKEHFVVFLATNKLCDSEKRKIMVIDKSKNPRCF